MFSNVYTQSSKRNPNICKKQSRMVWKWESIEYSATILERFPLSKDCLASSTWFHSFFKLSKSLYLLSRSPFLSTSTHFVSYNHFFFCTLFSKWLLSACFSIQPFSSPSSLYQSHCWPFNKKVSILNHHHVKVVMSLPHVPCNPLLCRGRPPLLQIKCQTLPRW